MTSVKRALILNSPERRNLAISFRCRYEVAERSAQDACPFNALYWDFLMRHEDRLGGNPRMRMMYRNVERLEPAEKAAISAPADWIRANVECL